MLVKNISASSRFGSNSTTSASLYSSLYLPMPTCMREWTMARKVCDSTTGRPPSLSRWRLPAPRFTASSESNGTSGLMQRTRLAPSLSAPEACSVFFSAPST